MPLAAADYRWPLPAANLLQHSEALDRPFLISYLFFVCFFRDSTKSRIFQPPSRLRRLPLECLEKCKVKLRVPLLKKVDRACDNEEKRIGHVTTRNYIISHLIVFEIFATEQASQFLKSLLTLDSHGRGQSREESQIDSGQDAPACRFELCTLPQCQLLNETRRLVQKCCRSAQR